ncbi:hypothetical protein PWT90_05367 [Aphanocladium album]|nr:hypothetical protein PWT90_05367 [Aphanocladium album]
MNSSNPDGNAPALEPPPGQQSHFDGRNGSLKPTIIATLAACLAVSTASLLVRAYAQKAIFRRYVWADVWLLFGWAAHVVFAAMLLACLPFGAGYHQWDVRLAAYHQIEFFLFVSFVLYDVAIVGAKVSILLQLSAIFSGTSRGIFYWVSMALILINVIFYVALSFALIFQCQPLEKAWRPDIPGKCVNQDVLLTSSGPFNIVSDFLMFLLPVWAILKLQLPIRRRLEVTGAFAIALFGCLCSAIRLVYSSRLKNSGDATWVIFQNQLWANAEITAGVLIASLFVVPRLIRHWRGQDTSYGSSGYNKYPSRGTQGGDADKSRHNTTWASRQSAPRSQHFSRDSYFELEETNKAFGAASNADVDSDDVALRTGASQLGIAKPHVQGRADGSISSHENLKDSTGIVKTVQIEWTEEPARGPPGAI